LLVGIGRLEECRRNAGAPFQTRSLFLGHVAVPAVVDVVPWFLADVADVAPRQILFVVIERLPSINKALINMNN
jgi:hypothetical protein